MDQLTQSYKELVRNSWRLFSLSHRAWNEPMTEAGLSSSTFPLLECVVLRPGISQQEIADELSMDKSVVSRGCRYLETEGFIRREKSLRVAHGFLCQPTEKGLKTCEEVLVKEQIKIQELFSGENPDCLIRANRLMKHLLEQMLKE